MIQIQEADTLWMLVHYLNKEIGQNLIKYSTLSNLGVSSYIFVTLQLYSEFVSVTSEY